MGLKCKNVEALRAAISNGCKEAKPNGQIKHQFKNCVVSTYDTGSIVVQDNTKEKTMQKKIESLVESINALGIKACDANSKALTE